jgi:hypothetical protein
MKLPRKEHAKAVNTNGSFKRDEVISNWEFRSQNTGDSSQNNAKTK